MRITAIRLAPEDADRYVVLRKQMLADSPWAFSADPARLRGGDAGHVISLISSIGELTATRS